MTDKQRSTSRKQPKDTKPLTVRQAYELHKMVSKDENYMAFVGGYMKGYYDAAVGKPHRYDDYFDREAAKAGNDLRAADPESKVEL